MPPTRAFLSLDGARPAAPDGAAPGGDAWIELIAWGLSDGQALDAASGLPTGKRQSPVLAATKPVDRVSRRLAAALDEGATLEECVLELWWPTPPPRRRRRIAELRDRQTIRLKDVRVVRIETILPDPTDDWSLYDRPLETVYLVAEKLTRTWGRAAVAVRFDDQVRRQKGAAVELSGTVTPTDAAGAALPGVKVKGKLLAGKKSTKITGKTAENGVLSWKATIEPRGGACTLRVTDVEGYEGGPWEARIELPAAERRLRVGNKEPVAGGRILSVTIVDGDGNPVPHAVVELVLSRKGSSHHPKKLDPTNARGKTTVALPAKWWGKKIEVEVASPAGG